MKNFLKSLIAVLVLLPFVAEARRDQARERAQQHRIRDGVKNGELTRAERRNLHHGQKRVDRAQLKAQADGVVTAKEKARLEHMQDHQSKKIHRLKNNDRDAATATKSPASTSSDSPVPAPESPAE